MGCGPQLQVAGGRPGGTPALYSVPTKSRLSTGARLFSATKAPSMSAPPTMSEAPTVFGLASFPVMPLM